MIRRFILAFGLGAFLTWQVSGTLPFDGEGENAWRAMLLVVMLVTALNVFMRMKQMRARFRR